MFKEYPGSYELIEAGNCPLGHPPLPAHCYICKWCQKIAVDGLLCKTICVHPVGTQLPLFPAGSGLSLSNILNTIKA